jgi:uncharacterized iron-regulated membrane protein
MSTAELLLSQAAISLLVVTCYHLWLSRKKQAAPPVSALANSSAPSVAMPAISGAIAPPTKTTPVAEQMPPEILAIIAAAIAVVLGQPYRVVSVQPSAAPMPELNVWALEGRMDQFKSHKVR